ncbi:hypothetical protein V6N11_053254 [Hibiscus sabdariffa]|uniref:Uncharacterized protein n=1 Tax=Hibiscus sabdariffa TaxID=183260 RepID=A0ABR2UD05_9ROSI
MFGIVEPLQNELLSKLNLPASAHNKEGPEGNTVMELGLTSAGDDQPRLDEMKVDNTYTISQTASVISVDSNPVPVTSPGLSTYNILDAKALNTEASSRHEIHYFPVLCPTSIPAGKTNGLKGQDHAILMTIGLNSYQSGSGQDVSDKLGIHLAPPPSSGSPIPLPTNEQQHNNHTDAVALAVANSTKPSSASPLQIPTLLCLFSSFLLLLLRVLL